MVSLAKKSLKPCLTSVIFSHSEHHALIKLLESYCMWHSEMDLTLINSVISNQIPAAVLSIMRIYIYIYTHSVVENAENAALEGFSQAAT